MSDKKLTPKQKAKLKEKEKKAKAKLKEKEKKAKAKLKEKEKKAIKRQQQEQHEARRLEIIKTYVDLVRKHQFVKQNMLIDAGVSADKVKHYFRSLERLNLAAREKYPKAFFDIFLTDELVAEQQQKLEDALNSCDRFLVTTVVTGCKVDKKLLKSMHNYCKRRNARILVLVASDTTHNLFAPGAQYGSIDRNIFDSEYVCLVTSNTQLNSNIGLSTIKLSAKQVDPATSMIRLAQTTGSIIYASPKQRLRASPVSNEKMPHFVMTTGAITEADYRSSNYMSNRSADIATHDHVKGCLVIEIEDDDYYHYRQIQCGKKGDIIDLSVRYNPNGSISKEKKPWLVMGDLHSSSIDPLAYGACMDICEEFGVEKIVVHDGFDGMSINHHERSHVVSRARNTKKNVHRLDAELKEFAEVLTDMQNYAEELVLVKSNHDEFLDRYLESGYFIKDPQNLRISLELAIALHDGLDPLRVGVEKFKPDNYNLNKVRWLDRDEDFVRAGVQLGAHGDKGNNGARGSLRSMEQAYGQSISGHAHSPEILRGAYQVGTTTKLKLGYNKGGSTWCHTSCLIYEDGRRQLINFIEGDWRT